MIDKKSFCSILEDCRRMEEYVDKLSEVNISLEDDHPYYTFVGHIIDMLDKQFNGEWVSYYFYERGCNGYEMRNEPTPLLWDENDREIWIHSDEELYDYLSKNCPEE